MVDLVGVLATAPGAVTVGPVSQDLHTAALTTRLLPALLLDHVELGHLVLLQAHGQQDVVLLDQHGGGGG